MRVGVTGHQGLSPATTELVGAALRELLATYRPLVVTTMLGPGADQLAARVALDLGGSLHVIVAAEQYRDAFTDPTARSGYDELLAQASAVERLPYVESTEAAHMAGGRAVVNASALLVAVWDGQPSPGLGGTGDVVEYARATSKPVEVIWPDGAVRE